MEILLLLLIVPTVLMLVWRCSALAGLPLFLQLVFIVLGGKLITPRRSPAERVRPPR